MSARRPIRLPKQWPAHVKSGVLHAISLASVVLSYARGRAVLGSSRPGSSPSRVCRRGTDRGRGDLLGPLDPTPSGLIFIHKEAALSRPPEGDKSP